MKTFIPLVLVLLALPLFPACGGGGGGGGPTAVSPVDGLSDPDAIEWILENCALAQAEKLLASLQVLADIIETSETSDAELEPSLVGTNLPGGVAGWTLDLANGGPTTDFTGTFTFRDDNGAPIDLTPYVTFLPTPSVDTEGLFAAIPDCGTITTDFTGRVEPTDPLLTGSIIAKVHSTDPTLLTATITASETDCSTTVAFEDWTEANLAGEYPVGTVDLTVEVPLEEVTGDIVFDNTDKAILTLQRNGGPEYMYQWDIDDQILTPLP